ncbi:RHS repeat-associated core domain protein [Leptospira santarosai str. HAI134]|nr:RHS repeat-associated core domain protein [Leptospira santarosai str. HAI134]
MGIAEGNLSRRFQQSFGYAKNGNLTSKRIHDPGNGNITDEWSYQYTNHQVTNIDSSKSGADTLTLQYDANGNLTRQRDNVKDLTKRINIDSQDRITQIQDGNNAILGSYWYDESGFRIRRSALEEKNNVFTNVEILYPSKFYGLEFIESENAITSVNNVYLNGVRIAAMNEAGALAYYLTDQVDSVSHVLDDEGNTLSQIQYQPYGETFVQRGDLNFSPKYNSQELDRESGFYFYNARYYDPGIARFTSADTLIPDEHNSQAWNRFAYVYNNPIGAKDPTGHVPQKSCGPEYCGGGIGGGGDSRGSHWANTSKNSDIGQGPSSGGVRGSSGNSGSGSNSGFKGSGGNNGSTRTSAKGSNTYSNTNSNRNTSKPSNDSSLKSDTGSKPSLKSHKEALKEVHDKVGKQPKGEPGKFGSPQAGNSKKGYRLDPGHPNARPGSGEEGHHINYWDYSGGKRGNGAKEGAIPIKD